MNYWLTEICCRQNHAPHSFVSIHSWTFNYTTRLEITLNSLIEESCLYVCTYIYMHLCSLRAMAIECTASSILSHHDHSVKCGTYLLSAVDCKNNILFISVICNSIKTCFLLNSFFLDDSNCHKLTFGRRLLSFRLCVFLNISNQQRWPSSFTIRGSPQLLIPCILC